MPNGNPDFNFEELEAFFGPFKNTLEAFSNKHNLSLENITMRAQAGLLALTTLKVINQTL